MLKKFKERNFYYEKSDEFEIHTEDFNNYVLTKIVNFKYKSKFKNVKYFNSLNKKKKINLPIIFFYISLNKYISKLNENKNLFHGINFDNSIIKTCELNIRNFQLPIFYYEKNYKKNDFNKNLRKTLFKKITKKIFYNFVEKKSAYCYPKAF